MLKKVKENAKKNVTVINYYRYMQMYYNKFFTEDKRYIEKKFKKKIGRTLNLQNPQKFNDKIQWLKLNWYDPIAKQCVDKDLVREYVADKVGDTYLNEVYDVYTNLNEISLNKLPDKFVLKGTHGSAFNIVCSNKSDLNWNTEFKKMKRWLNTDYFWLSREWVYKDLKPKIVSEKFLSDSTGKPPMDYKIFCFHGEPRLIQVDVDRFGTHKQNFYDTEWNFRDVKIWCDNEKDIVIPKPENFDKMMEISRELSKDFPHVRVDLYNIDGVILFGELTFFHLSGLVKFKDENLELEMGSWLDLSTIDKNGVYKYEK